jgi:hypothetical protein
MIRTMMEGFLTQSLLMRLDQRVLKEDEKNIFKRKDEFTQNVVE